ncbi:MAG: methionine adenosyltransferase [Candidatus Bipolaricaulia bacterium]
MATNGLFTAESVTEGHPDKMADQISDAVLDALIAQDPDARVACETFLTTGLAFIGGEITTSGYVDVPKVVRTMVEQIGYTRIDYGFDHKNVAVITSIDEQSPDIAIGVDHSLESKAHGPEADERESLGAGDQGIMVGYACTETPELMPLPITLAHALTRRLAEVRKQKVVDYLRPDGKSQVTVEYRDGKPERVTTVVVSAQHEPDVTPDQLREDITRKVIEPALGGWFDERIEFFVNPTGRFVIGGPQGDTGLTGRKVMVDSYGVSALHGGGCFSGKDPTKVDRSGSYAARYVAKNIVAAELAERCQVHISYSIGKAEPLAVSVETFGTTDVAESVIVRLIAAHFDLRPGAIIEKFDLRRPIYTSLAAYGHFGRTDLDLSWERTDIAETLRQAI